MVFFQAYSISGLLGLQGGLPDLQHLKRKREAEAEEEKLNAQNSLEEECKRFRSQYPSSVPSYPAMWGKWGTAAGPGIKEEKAVEGGAEVASYAAYSTAQEGLYDAMSQAYPALPVSLGRRSVYCSLTPPSHEYFYLK